MTLTKLITEAKQGSNAAQQFLFEKLSGQSKMLCLRYVRNNEDAEEIMLDGFYRFFINLHDFKYESEVAVYAYLRKIMVNQCLKHLRKTGTMNIVSDNEITDLASPDSVFEKLESSLVYDIVLRLPVGYRTVFNLYEVEGYEHKHISALLGITESASRSNLCRAKALLQKMLTSINPGYENERTKQP